MKVQFGKILQFAILAVLLVGLPVGSWIYLKKGAEFRKTHLDQMGDFGAVQFSNENFQNDKNTLNADSLDDRVLVIGILDKENPRFEAQAGHLAQQFGTRTDTRILKINTAKSAPDIFRFSKINPDLEYYVSAPVSPAILKQCNIKSDSLVPPYWLLVNEKGTIRRFYTTGEFDLLITHTAIVVPTDSRKSAELKRKREI